MQQLRLVFRIYAPIVHTYRTSAFLTMVFFGVATVSGSVFTPLLVKHIMDIVATATVPAHAVHTILTLFILFAFSRVLTQTAYRLGDYYATIFQVSAMHDIAITAFRHLTRHSYDFFTHQFTGSLVSNTNKLVRSFEQIADFLTFNFFSEGSRLVISSIVLLSISPILGCIFVGLLVGYFTVYSLMLGHKMRLDEARNAAESRTTGALADALTNILSIKIFAQTAVEWAHFGSIVGKERAARMASWKYSNTQTTVQRIVLVTFELVAMGSALYLWTHNTISAGTIVLLQMYLVSATDIVFNLSRNFTRTLGAVSDACTMASILESEESVQDPRHPEVPRIHRGHIEIQDITFAYGENEPVFQNFSLTIPAGQKVGLVGHSGSGKTTITKLLLRFLDVQSGTITIDGQDIRTITQEDLRARIAYVPQEPLLFHRTIAENILYGKPDASRETLHATATRAHADEFISRLSDGYATLVGERGVRLSGGERQRVAIARAMIKDAPILILDEATSALDSVSERHIQEAFEDAMHGRTAIVIAHRLSTIQKLDRIIVFEKGAIVEDGTHAELLEKNGVYAHLWQQQAGGFIADE